MADGQLASGMRILVIGGTRFVGRYIVEAALAAGHDVTLVHRGRTGTELFPAATHILADRNDAEALSAALVNREWDATVDVCAYLPPQVDSLADALGRGAGQGGRGGRGGQFCFISTVSVYDPEHPGFGEDARVHEFDTEPPTEVT